MYSVTQKAWLSQTYYTIVNTVCLKDFWIPHKTVAHSLLFFVSVYTIVQYVFIQTIFVHSKSFFITMVSFLSALCAHNNIWMKAYTTQYQTLHNTSIILTAWTNRSLLRFVNYRISTIAFEETAQICTIIFWKWPCLQHVLFIMIFSKYTFVWDP